MHNGSTNCSSKTCTQLQIDARNVDAAIPLRSADTELQSTIELQHATVEHIAWMQQLQCTNCLNTCKTQYHSIIKEEEKSPGTISSTARAVRARFYGKATTPETVARASHLFSATEPRFTPKKTQCFVQTLSNRILDS